MNKTDLISKVAEAAGTTKKDAEAVIDALIQVIPQEIAQGEKITLPNFGSFEVTERAAREGRNPRDPEQKIQIPACKALKFKQSKKIKELLNDK